MKVDWLIKLLKTILNFLSLGYRYKMPEFRHPKKVTVILPDFIGDAILLTPFLKNLRHNLGKNALIDIVCNSQIGKMLNTSLFISNIYIKSYASKNKIYYLTSRKYDTIFILNFSPAWAWAAFIAGVKQRITPDFTRAGLKVNYFFAKIFTHILPYTSIDDKTPQVEVYNNMLRALGLSVPTYLPEIKLTNADILGAQKLMNDPYSAKALVHITAGSIGKQWDLNNWYEVINYLRQKGYEIYCTGSKKDSAIYEFCAQKTKANIINLCGTTSLRETIALMKFMKIVITTDSAPAHMAGLAEAENIVVIYGPTNNYQWNPISKNSNIQQVYLDMKCRPCLTRSCSSKKCLSELKAHEVIAVIKKLTNNVSYGS